MQAPEAHSSRSYERSAEADNAIVYLADSTDDNRNQSTAKMSAVRTASAACKDGELAWKTHTLLS